ncbi:hypothetical protein DSUL_50229 [Desulfovibrionales bacterium]
MDSSHPSRSYVYVGLSVEDGHEDLSATAELRQRPAATDAIFFMAVLIRTL